MNDSCLLRCRTTPFITPRTHTESLWEIRPLEGLTDRKPKFRGKTRDLHSSYLYLGWYFLESQVSSPGRGLVSLGVTLLSPYTTFRVPSRGTVEGVSFQSTY